MHTVLTALAPYLTGALLAAAGAVLALGARRLKTWRASTDAAAHPLESQLADLAIDVANDALALLRANPALTPAGVAAWALQELQAKAPAAVVTLGDAAVQAGLQELTRKSLLSVAQSGTIDQAATAMITAMAPTAKTARVTPPQIAAVLADAAVAAPDVEAAIAGAIPTIVERVVALLHGTALATPAEADAPAAPSLVGPATPAGA
ncbi:hypothetical protein [Acidisoma sp. 7E03]